MSAIGKKPLVDGAGSTGELAAKPIRWAVSAYATCCRIKAAPPLDLRERYSRFDADCKN
jgi:hypothetical protein